MKRYRQDKILELIANQDIETQHALASALVAAGFPSTQATISRDIRELGLLKELLSSGGYRYAAPSRGVGPEYQDRLRTIFKESVTSIAIAQNLVVLRTLPGLASAACSALDGMNFPGLVGTLAGDDTAFLAMVDNRTAELLQYDISAMLV